jgi:carnitine O-acetyltransferase
LRTLRAIVADSDKTAPREVARGAVGVLTTENRKIWSELRNELKKDRNNAACLEVVDSALFVVCLDDASPKDLSQLCASFLCGTYELDGGVQIGTCTNRWYDKVCEPICLKLLTKPFDSFKSLSVLMAQLESTSSTLGLMDTRYCASQQTSTRTNSCSWPGPSIPPRLPSSMHLYHPMRNRKNVKILNHLHPNLKFPSILRRRNLNGIFPKL